MVDLELHSDRARHPPYRRDRAASSIGGVTREPHGIRDRVAVVGRVGCSFRGRRHPNDRY